ncbi:unnamed protein product [Anisakis simplex]|uniref:MFS domain-containing protein n=1 Tax=Anisakis simplex TaxID=6269 RepID=A0A0M3K1Q7_ANISI|nr:unnamed protein product [Anisakis simplex]
MSGVGLKDETKTEEKKRLTEKDMEAAAADSDDEQRDIVEAKLANAAVITPPDGGYGWVIVIASFFANLFVDGIIFTVGQSLLSIWEREFETSAMAASWAQSLLGGCYLLAGPLASALANRFGCRSVVIGGTVMVFIGFMTSVLVPALPILYVTFGIIGGIGFGLVYLPAIVIVNQWFEKKRAFALGLAVCGSGIGTTIFSQINPLLLNLNHGNWRTFLMNIAVISLLCIVCGLFFKTPQANEKQVEEVAKIVTSYQEQRQHSKSPFSGTPATTLQEETPAEANGGGGGGDQNETQQSGNDSEDPFRRRVTSCNARVGDRPTRKRWFSTSGDQVNE